MKERLKSIGQWLVIVLTLCILNSIILQLIDSYIIEIHPIIRFLECVVAGFLIGRYARINS